MRLSSELGWTLASVAAASAIMACGARSGFEVGGATAHGGGGSGGSETTSSSSSSSSSSSTGGGAMCGVETDGTVSVDIARYMGSVLGCAHSTAGGEKTTSFKGAIVSSQGGSIEVDECSPAADCIAQISKISIQAQGIGEAFLPTGAFVEVRLQESDNKFFCLDTVMIKNLPSWDGAPNPVDQGDHTWLVGSNTAFAFPDAGYRLEAVPLGCFPGQTSPCGPHEDYVFRVTVGSMATDIPMGTAAEVGAPSWVFSNISSYSTDVCDVPPSFAYLLLVPHLD